MRRRTFLTVAGSGLTALSGCLGGGSDDPAATDPSTSGSEPTEKPPDTGGLAAADAPTTAATTETGRDDESTDGPVGREFVREVLVVPEVAAPNSPDSYGVYGERDEQFVIARLSGREGSAPPVEDIELVAGDHTGTATTDVGRGRWGLFDYGEAYGGPEYPNGWVLVRVPKPLDVADATLTWPGGERALGDDALARLRRPPTSFEVQSFEAPESAAPGDTVGVSVTVENVGDVEGVFVGALNRSWPYYGPEATPRLALTAGETATWSHEFPVERGSTQDSTIIFLPFSWRGGRLTREVEVQFDGATPG